MDRYKFHRPKRNVHTIFIHCSASDNEEFDNIDTIRGWHLERGFQDVGYHYFIQKSGYIQPGRSLEKIPAGQKGHNTGTIAICLHGLEEKEFTGEQYDALRDLCLQMQRDYNGSLTFRGHCEVSPKTCPVFDYKDVLSLDDNNQMKFERMLLKDAQLSDFQFKLSDVILEVYK